MKALNEIMRELENVKASSTWKRGVKEYASELLENVEEYERNNGEPITNINELESVMLCGADNWRSYSYGGCSLIYDSDICERLATPSERKRKDGGRLYPNSRETWLDVQARALYQAARMIKNIAR